MYNRGNNIGNVGITVKPFLSDKVKFSNFQICNCKPCCLQARLQKSEKMTRGQLVFFLLSSIFEKLISGQLSNHFKLI